MASIDYRMFHEFVMPNVQGCPVGIATSAIRSAVIEFCEASKLSTLNAEKRGLLAGQARYSFAAPAGTKVVEVVYASLNDKSLIKTTLDDLDELYDGWRDLISEFPTMYFMDTAETIRVVGTPMNDVPDRLEVQVARKPARSSNTCPDFIFENWAEVIAHGALSRLHAMSGKTWADTGMVAYHRRKFRDGLSRAKSKALRSRQSVPRRIIPRNFGEF